jgi:hypothetical protein
MPTTQIVPETLSRSLESVRISTISGSATAIVLGKARQVWATRSNFATAPSTVTVNVFSGLLM